jgi:hypothetical protein
MRIKKHTELHARKLARRRFKDTIIRIVAFGGRKIAATADYQPIRADIKVAFFVETGEHIADDINPMWEHVAFSGYGRNA